jgi:hypothetical protein
VAWINSHRKQKARDVSVPRASFVTPFGAHSRLSSARTVLNGREHTFQRGLHGERTLVVDIPGGDCDDHVELGNDDQTLAAMAGGGVGIVGSRTPL